MLKWVNSATALSGYSVFFPENCVNAAKMSAWLC